MKINESGRRREIPPQNTFELRIKSNSATRPSFFFSPNFGNSDVGVNITLRIYKMTHGLTCQHAKI